MARRCRYFAALDLGASAGGFPCQVSTVLCCGVSLRCGPCRGWFLCNQHRRWHCWTFLGLLFSMRLFHLITKTLTLWSVTTSFSCPDTTNSSVYSATGLLEMAETLPEGDISDWRSIVTLVVFVLTSESRSLISSYGDGCTQPFPFSHLLTCYP